MCTCLESTIPHSTEYVYFLSRADGAIKIGWSKHTVSRKYEMEKTHGPLLLIACHPGGHTEEQDLHDRFKPYRINQTNRGEREWYHPEFGLLQHINSII